MIQFLCVLLQLYGADGFFPGIPRVLRFVSEILEAIQKWTWFGNNNTKASTQLWTLHFCWCYSILHLLIHGIVSFPCPCRNLQCSGVLHLPWPLMGREEGGCHGPTYPSSTHCPQPRIQRLYSPFSMGCWLSCSITMLIWRHSWCISQCLICPSRSLDDAGAVQLSTGETCLNGFWQQPHLFKRSV